ncbi:hypothetical protein [Streptomyces sp. BH104]|uniref:hypothetical protein n=1 Tax=Streptomyces sp. BH104 TaxID=3410407 RepID=UPI003BB667D5
MTGSEFQQRGQYVAGGQVNAEYVSLNFSQTYPSVEPDAAIRGLLDTGEVVVRRIDEIDPIRDLGIHPPLQLNEWLDLPPYVTRAIDGRLDDLVNRGGLVVIEGNSASGKTRSAFEAILRNKERLNAESIVIPTDGVSLRKLISCGFQFDGSIVWLDNLERYIGLGGLDEGIVRLFGPDSGVLFIATLRSRAKVAMAQAGDSAGRSLASVYQGVMAGARTVRVDRRLNKKERWRAGQLAADLRINAALEVAETIGFAEFIAAAPSALERWRDGRDGANEIGAALISAAVDFRRAGYASAIPRTWLEAVFKFYLDERTVNRVTAEDVERGFSWAVELIRGASSCLEVLGDGMYAPFDYLVDFSQAQSEEKVSGRSTFQNLTDIPDDLWHELADRIKINDPSFMSCVSLASLSPHPGLEYVYRTAMRDGVIPVESLNDPGALLNFIRSCMDARMCIVCQAVRLEVDLVPVLRVLLAEFSRIREEEELTSLQVECVHALHDLGDGSDLQGSESPLAVAAAHFPSDQWRKVGEFLLRVGPGYSGRCWIAFADTREGKPASWPVSLEKAQAVYLRKNWPIDAGDVGAN